MMNISTIIIIATANLSTVDDNNDNIMSYQYITDKTVIVLAVFFIQ